MKIEPQAFIVIEKSMSAAMQAEWDRLAALIVSQLHDASNCNDWA